MKWDYSFNVYFNMMDFINALDRKTDKTSGTVAI